MNIRSLKVVLLIACLGVLANNAIADVKLPALFSDNMVLQRDAIVPIWGTADPGEPVAVLLGFQQQKTVADNSGKWMVKFPPMSVRSPFDVNVIGKNSITLHNVVVGEVWVCSGQSNMAFTLNRVINAPQEMSEANYPMIRMFKVKNAVAEQPLTDVTGQWDVCAPQTSAAFSAVGYFFGRELYKKLGVPIGLIHSSWGGTPAEAWTSRPVLEGDAELKTTLGKWTERMERLPQDQAAYERRLNTWRNAAAKAREEGKPEPARPPAPQGQNSPHRPASLYNGMIAPLIPYGIKGAIWYQGESNAGNARLYQKLFPSMIQNWRRDWGQGDFPFLFVQLANYMKREEQPSESNWAELRESQLKTLSLPRTGMAVIIDVGESGDIHPRNKQTVGYRLALPALAKEYGQKIPYSGPIYDSVQVEGNKIRLRFKHAQEGLIAYGIESSRTYEVVPPDHWSYRAITQLLRTGIDGDHTIFNEGRPATRYQFALTFLSFMRKVSPFFLDEELNGILNPNRGPQGPPGPVGDVTDPAVAADPRFMTRQQLRDLIKKIAQEFDNELILLGHKFKLLQHLPVTAQGFSIAGADKKFVWANTQIEGNEVIVWNDQVPNPVAVRYAWANNPVANLYNKSGLPASPFRTDDWSSK